MAQNPIGTVTDEERLVPLFAREGDFLVDVTDPVRMADVPDEGTFAWRLREAGDVPRLAFAPVEDADEAGALPIRDLTASDDTLTLEVPESLLVDGLGLDASEYDDENPLLFRPDELDEGIAVGMTPEGEPGGATQGAIELVPVRFADGTPFSDEPRPDVSLDSDPVAEAAVAGEEGDEATPRSETISAPIDAAVVDEVLDTTDVPREDVVRALETIHRNDLVGQADDDSAYEPLTAGGRALVALDDETWSRVVASELDVDDAVVDVLRELYIRQGDVLLQDAEEDVERFEGRTPVVIHPDRTYEEGSDPEWKPD